MLLLSYIKWLEKILRGAGGKKRGQREKGEYIKYLIFLKWFWIQVFIFNNFNSGFSNGRSVI